MGLKHINLYDEVMVCEDKESSLIYYPDGLHPSDLGHDIISDKIVEFIKNDK
jgi:lysophospholipase L1-like esterase